MKATIEYLLDGKLTAVNGEIEAPHAAHFSVTDGEAFAFLNPAPATYRDVLTAEVFGVSFGEPLTFEVALAELLAGAEATKAIEAAHEPLRTEAAKKVGEEIRKKAEKWKTQ